MNLQLRHVLTLPEKKVKKAKPMEPFQKDFATCIATNIENEINIVPFFRAGKDLIQALENKIFQILKTLNPIGLLASDKEKNIHAAKEKSYRDIYEKNQLVYEIMMEYR